MISPLYERKIANVKCKLQPGYETIRSAMRDENKNVDVHLKIVKSNDGPRCKAFTKIDPIINVRS